MPPPLPSFVAAGYGLPEYCEPSNAFLVYVSSCLNSCIPTPLAFVSSALGTLSVISWLFAQLPQIYKNYKLKSTSGLSIYFLVEWCLGDSSNVVGAVLTRQAGWQVFVAAYYVLVDITLVVQFYWYTYFKKYDVDQGDETPSRRDGGGMLGISTTIAENGARSRVSVVPRQMPATPKSDSKSMVNTSLAVVSPTPIEDSNSNSTQLPSYPNEKKYRLSKPARSSPSPPGGGLIATRTLLITSMFCAVFAQASSPPGQSPADPNNLKLSPTPLHTSSAELIGRIFSWLSTALYLFSRPPQLYKNYVRQSTAGLSPLLFTAAFSGNLFYSASLLTNPFGWSSFPPYGGGGWADAHGSDRLDWITRSIPFFLGAFCVLFMDGFMGVQFLMYGSHDDYDLVQDDEDGDADEDDDDGIARRADDNKEGRRRCMTGGFFPFFSKHRGPGHGEPASMPGLDQEQTALLGSIERDNGRYGTV